MEILATLLCMKRDRAARMSLKRSIRRTIKSSSAVNHDQLVSSLFQPLKSQRDPLNCLKKSEAHVEDVFCFQKKIGAGGFSEVWLARYQHKPKEDPVAIKLMAKNRVPSSTLVTEISVLKVTHNCPFVAQMSSNFQTPTHFAIVMKYATGGTLHERVKMIRRFSELVARFYAAEIAEGLFGLHGRGIIHRDLNLDNVLIDENGHVILTDFGLSLLRDPSEMDELCAEAWADACKAQFPAPELLLGHRYDKSVDWWAYGIMLYRMVVGEYPFLKRRPTGQCISDYSMESIYRKEEYPNYLSPQVKTLISRLLTRQNKHRLGRGAFEESDVTNMDFFYNVNWCLLRDHALPAPFHNLVQHQHAPQHSKKIPLATTHIPGGSGGK